jgi:feruloyl-CoA synthase
VPATGTARADRDPRGCARPPAGLDAGEITDEGYVNQRQVLADRAALVELLYAEPDPGFPAGVVAERTA